MSNNKQLSELATLYRELPAHKQKQAREFIAMTTGTTRGCIWSWCAGKTRIPYKGIETSIINYLKKLQNDTTGIN